MEAMTLRNGVEMPKIHFGTWRLGMDTAKETVLTALRSGYTGLDCAYSYGNDFYVGKAIKESGLPRESLFVTNKVWRTFRDADQVVAACRKSLKLMKLSYFDLYLIHWPVPMSEDGWQAANCAVWQGMETLYREGLVRAIGVSNFKPHHLRALLEGGAEIVPMVNQIEYHPGIDQRETLDFCAEQGIAVEGWSPLGSGALLTHPHLRAMAEQTGKTPAQLCLRYALQKGVSPVPRSSDARRMAQNLNVFDFVLTEAELAALEGLREVGCSGFDPDTCPPEA